MSAAEASRESTPLISDDGGSVALQHDIESSASTKSPTLIVENSEEPHQYDVKNIIISLWVGSFLSLLDSTVVASTMSGILSEFKDSDNVTWIAASYLLTNTAFQPLYGKTSDIIGRKQCLLFAQFWFALGCVLCSMSQSLPQFAVARAIAGIGGGGLSSLSSIIVSDIVSLEERGMFQGYANLVYGTAQSLGGPIGGLCLQTIGWRWMFAAQAPMTLICMVLASKHVNIKGKTLGGITRSNLARIDFLGSFCLIVATSSLLFLLSLDVRSNFLIVSCLVGLCSFVYVEVKVAKEPVIPPHLFKGILGVTLLTASLGMSTYYSSLFLVPLYLEIVQGISASTAGLFIIFQVGPVLFGSLYAGSYLRVVPAEDENAKNQIIILRAGKLVVLSTVLGVIGVLIIQIETLLTPVDAHSGLFWKLSVLLGLSLNGFGTGTQLVALLVLAVALVGKEGQAALSSMNYLLRAVGQCLSVSVSLSFYKKQLNHNLRLALKGTEGSKSLLAELLKDSHYVRLGLEKSLQKPVLKAFQQSVTRLFVPTEITGVIAIVFSVILVVKKNRN